MQAIARKLPTARVDYADGGDVGAAAALARQADVAVVFATRWESEGHDAENLSLPDGQDRLIAAVAAANPRTVVVLETGNPVLMPWRDRVGAILEAWYPGARGGEAIADILVWRCQPVGPLADQLSGGAGAIAARRGAGTRRAVGHARRRSIIRKARRSAINGSPRAEWRRSFRSATGSAIHVLNTAILRSRDGERCEASFTVTQCRRARGGGCAQLYARMPGADGNPVERLVGWSRVKLAPGESAPASRSRSIRGCWRISTPRRSVGGSMPAPTG